jgi:hypothetical protein
MGKNISQHTNTQLITVSSTGQLLALDSMQGDTPTLMRAAKMVNLTSSLSRMFAVAVL